MRARNSPTPGGLTDLKAGTAPDPQTFTTANVPDQMMSMQPNEMKKVQKAYTVCPIRQTVYRGLTDVCIVAGSEARA